tara:strand:+ start:329 stop:505 length:177 start_codon:yes stop_codon:yes gene_type:complete
MKNWNWKKWGSPNKETVIDIAEEIDVDGEMMKGIEGPSQYDEEGMRGMSKVSDISKGD